MIPRRLPSRSRGPTLGIAILGLVARNAAAQSAPASPTPDERREAGAAFDRAVAARAAGDSTAAADLFETANRLAPSAQALGNAIRAHRDAHSPAHDARAATLSLRLIGQYGSEPRYVSFANTVIAALSPGLTRVTVQCARCDLELDRALTADTEFFLEPGAHALAAHWSDHRVATRDVSATAGASTTVTLEPPALRPVAPPPAVAAVVPVQVEAQRSPTPTVATWSPAVFVTLGSATVVSGVLLAISTVDMYAGVAAYTANPTRDGLLDGQSRELRTDVLIGTTVGFGAVAVTSLFFTRWHGPRIERAAPAVATAAGTVPGLTFAGRF